VALTGSIARADTIAIAATGDITWSSGKQQSTTDGKPLVVTVKKGDILEIQIPPNAGPHGLVTINKGGMESDAAEERGYVQACGQQPASKDAKVQPVLREIECSGTSSNFGKEFVGTFKLEVLQTFQDVNFWCVLHQGGMWGTLKLQP
jgi:hypothetical protein